MRIPISSALLLGVIVVAQVSAQSQSSLPQSHLDVAITYGAMRPGGKSSFWMQNGGVQLHGQFWRGLGTVADIGRMHTANVNGSGVGLDLVTATFGPRYTWQPAHRRESLFGQFLIGQAFGFHSVFPSASGASKDAYGMALQVGGGIDCPLSHHFALRAIEASWVRTELPNSGANVQNSLRLGAGAVFHFR